MKFRRLFFLALFLLLVIAWFTRPSLEAFNKFYRDEVAAGVPPVIDFSDKFLYSSVTVNFYTAARIEPGTPKKAVSVKKEEFLGLFGKFWKL
ncbi:MAG: hypothetical protein EOO05_01050 [Chitinophagaceae bacterium]|nr:MAG: hypothetical protein EOO05_01050 [Chitinophagaceae bacterium]